MKTKITSKLFLAVAGLFLMQIFSSCNSLEITKRRYNKGFYIDMGVGGGEAKRIEKNQDVKSTSTITEKTIAIDAEQKNVIESISKNAEKDQTTISTL